MRIVYVGNFERLSIGEPEIAKCLEAEGHEVVRMQEQQATIAEIEKETERSDMLLVCKFRNGTPRQRAEFMIRKSIPMVAWLFDLYIGL